MPADRERRHNYDEVAPPKGGSGRPAGGHGGCGRGRVIDHDRVADPAACLGGQLGHRDRPDLSPHHHLPPSGSIFLEKLHKRHEKFCESAS